MIRGGVDHPGGSKISVVTPSYNQVQFIERTIQSVLSQDWEPLEYVVFDGGSTDGTLDILEKYTGQVRWSSERDGGQADAVNKGIRATDGSVIGWLNSDDVYYPGAVRAVMEYFQSHPDIDIVYGRADHIDINDTAFEDYSTEPWDFARLQEACFLSQPAVFFRRSVVDRYGLLDPDLQFCMDYEYWLRLGAAGARFGYLERKLAGSRLYKDNKTVSAGVKVHAEINDMFRQSFGRVPDRWLMNYAHVCVRRRLNRTESPRRFVLEVGLISLLSALRWNGRISLAMARNIHEWIREVMPRRGLRA